MFGAPCQLLPKTCCGGLSPGLGCAADPLLSTSNPAKLQRGLEVAGLVFGEDQEAVGGLMLDRNFLTVSDTRTCGKMAALEKLLALWYRQRDNKVCFFRFNICFGNMGLPGSNPSALPVIVLRVDPFSRRNYHLPAQCAPRLVGTISSPTVNDCPFSSRSGTDLQPQRQDA